MRTGRHWHEIASAPRLRDEAAGHRGPYGNAAPLNQSTQFFVTVVRLRRDRATGNARNNGAFALDVPWLAVTARDGPGLLDRRQI